MKSRNAPVGRFDLGSFATAVEARLSRWQEERVGERVWQRDVSLWGSPSTPDIADRLGWLDLPTTMRSAAEDFMRLGEEVREEGIRHVVLLGMGGSSLAPEVFAQTFGPSPDFPELLVLDSTHPMAILGVRRQIDLRSTVFVVSSKSGTTLETLSLFRYFWSEVGKDPMRGGRFIAVTDAGTPLETLGRERDFRRVVQATPDVGGRYSALTAFGLVPAALLGIDLRELLRRAERMAALCGPKVPASENPGLRLGAAFGELGSAGVDKITLVASSSLAAYPIWAEQLIAESTGKEGRGLIPVAGETLREPPFYAKDRLFVGLHAAGDSPLPSMLSSIAMAGHPAAQLELSDRYDIAAEFFRWEFAVATAGPLLGIHPFNQPDVEFAKELAREVMAGHAPATSVLPEPVAPMARHPFVEWSQGAAPPMYVAIQAYLAPGGKMDAALSDLREALRTTLKLPVTLGYGPRFLHSTGQLQKGGPSTVLCLQLQDTGTNDIPVPEMSYTFGQVIRAQAQGDAQALAQRRRRVLRIQLGPDPVHGLAQLVSIAATPSGEVDGSHSTT